MNVRSSIFERNDFREDLTGGLNSSQNWLSKRGKDKRTKGEEKYYSSSQASEALLENKRLLQRISQLETEREILKKALSIISRQT